MAKSDNRTIYERLYDYQTRLQGVANDLALKLAAIIAESDPKVMRYIATELPHYKRDIKTEMDRLAKILEKVEKIRSSGYDQAKDLLLTTSADVAKAGTDEAAKEANQALAEASRAEREKRFCKTLTDNQRRAIIDGQGIDGATIGQWFDHWKRGDLESIADAIQKASVEELSVAGITKLVRGTIEQGYTDGALGKAQIAAARLARTIINGVSNNARAETIKENSDVIDGVKFVGTLDGKTCPYCGSLDGHVWRGKEMDNARRPPLHPNCRCTIVSYFERVDENGNVVEDAMDRPAANADFDALAKEAYNKRAREIDQKRKESGKKDFKPAPRWDDLAPSTRLKYYYKAQKDFEKTTGKPAYRQVPGSTTFAEYFKGQSEDFKRSWLGAKKYELYKNGQLDEKKLFAPDLSYQYSSKSLVKFTGDADAEALDLIVDAYKTNGSPTLVKPETAQKETAPTSGTPAGSSPQTTPNIESNINNPLKEVAPGQAVSNPPKTDNAPKKTVEEQLADLEKEIPRNAEELLTKLAKYRELKYGKEQGDKMTRKAKVKALIARVSKKALWERNMCGAKAISLHTEIELKKRNPKYRLKKEYQGKSIEELEVLEKRFDERRARCDKFIKKFVFHKYHNPKFKLRDKVDERNDDRASVWETLHVLFPNNSGHSFVTSDTENAIKSLATSPESKESIDEVLKLYHTIASSCNTSGASIEQIAETRFEAEKGAWGSFDDSHRIIRINPTLASPRNSKQLGNTLVHEMGHWLELIGQGDVAAEETSKWICAQQGEKFKENSSTEDKVKCLKNPNLVWSESHSPSDYAQTIYRNYTKSPYFPTGPKSPGYVRKPRVSEAISVGMEGLLSDPEQFALRHPEHFNRVIEVLRRFEK